MEIISLWENVPGSYDTEPTLEYYPSEHKITKGTIICLPGGGYTKLSAREGTDFARFFNSLGMDAFVCRYRVFPHRFPLPLLDVRRSVRYIRANADRFGIDPQKIAVIGCSAGGHLAALLSNYMKPIDYEGCDEIDDFSPYPNASALCYSVIHPTIDSGNIRGTFKVLLGEDRTDYSDYSADILVNDATPPTFIWSTADDDNVTVINSYLYAKALREHNIPHEMHIFPHGRHGLALAEESPHVAQWKDLIKNWFKEISWL